MPLPGSWRPYEKIVPAGLIWENTVGNPVRACKDIENDARLRDIRIESYAK